MRAVLVVSQSDKTLEALSALLRSGEAIELHTAASAEEARAQSALMDFDAVILDAPLDGCVALARELARGSVSGVIVLVRAERSSAAAERLEPEGVFVLAKPLNRAMFFQAYRYALATRSKVQGMKEENARLQEKLEEIRWVDRAKCVLIQYLGMTEPQAHRYIEKQAMDLRCPKREVAINVLKTYEN